MSQIAVLIGFFAAIFAIAAIGALFTPGPWYETLAKPSWTPPDALFAPVWTILYAMIAVSGWLCWRSAGFAAAAPAFAAYTTQLALNAAWSWLFFGQHRVGLALIDIGLLLACIALTIVLFRRHDGLAAALLVPYFLWVTYATALNGAIWQLNR